MIGSVEEFAQLATSQVEDDYLRAISDEAPTFVWEEIVRHRPDLCEIVASSANVPTSVLESIALSGPWRARFAVACHPRTPSHVLDRLSRDPDSRVRRALLSNDATPLSVLAAMRENGNDDIAEVLELTWLERAARRGARHSAINTPEEVCGPEAQPIPTDSTVGRYQTYFDQLCSERGLDSSQVLRIFDPRDPDLPPPPAGPWLVAPWGEEYVVGTMRGEEFTIYCFTADLGEAVNTVARLVHEIPQTKVAPSNAQEIGRRTGFAISSRTEARGGKPGSNELAPGNLLDCFDDDRTHFLFAYGTPLTNRAQDERVKLRGYHAYEVLAPMPMAVVEGIVAPTETHAGGGAIVVLDRPLRWYLDNGYLVEIQ